MDIRKELVNFLREQSQLVSITTTKASRRYPGAYQWKKQCTSVNLNGLYNRVQMNTKDLSRIAIVERMKLHHTVGEQMTSLDGIKR